MILQYTYQSLCAHIGIGPLMTTTTNPAFTTPPRASIKPSQIIFLPIPFPCPFCNPSLRPAPPSGSGVLACLSSSTNSFPDKWRVLRLCNFEDLTAADWEVDNMKECQYRHAAWIARPVGAVEVGSDGERRAGVKWKSRVGEDGMETKFEGLLQSLRGVGV